MREKEEKNQVKEKAKNNNTDIVVPVIWGRGRSRGQWKPREKEDEVGRGPAQDTGQGRAL